MVYLPLWEMMDFASWDDDIPNWMGNHILKFHGSSHHQADIEGLAGKIDGPKWITLALCAIFQLMTARNVTNFSATSKSCPMPWCWSNRSLTVCVFFVFFNTKPKTLSPQANLTWLVPRIHQKTKYAEQVKIWGMFEHVVLSCKITTKYSYQLRFWGTNLAENCKICKRPVHWTVLSVSLKRSWIGTKGNSYVAWTYIVP